MRANTLTAEQMQATPHHLSPTGRFAFLDDGTPYHWHAVLGLWVLWGTP